MEYHNITNEDIKHFILGNNEDAKKIIATKFKNSIRWEELLKKVPSKESYNLAYSVGTNLVSLSEKKVDALSDYAEWLTELQVKTYLPHLLKNN